VSAVNSRDCNQQLDRTAVISRLLVRRQK